MCLDFRCSVYKLYHFVRTKNLPHSLDEIKRVASRCHVCCEFKPQFLQPQKVPLIKATRPFERINLDFKGPFPSVNGNKYFLNVIYEYSRFQFVFPCPDVSAATIIKCLITLFSLFAMPAYVHSDSGASFMNQELRAFFGEKGIATSRTTSYNPEGNGQVEKYDGVVWQAVIMALKSKGLTTKYWQDVLPDVLQSIRFGLSYVPQPTRHHTSGSLGFQGGHLQAPPFPLGYPNLAQFSLSDMFVLVKQILLSMR